MLTSDRNDDTLSVLKFVNVHDSLVAKLLKVESISFVEVGGDRLGVVVDHDRLLAHLANGSRTGDGAPVELDRRADSVNTRSENHGTVLVELEVVGRGVVGCVEVVGVSRELGGERVDSLDEGGDAEGLSMGSNLVFGGLNEVGNLGVRESRLLGRAHDVGVDRLERGRLKDTVDVADVVKLVKEPLVNLGEIVDAVDRVVLVEHSVRNGEKSSIVVGGQGLVKIFRLPVGLEPGKSRVDLTNRLLEGLLKCSADSHDLSDRLHGGADVSLNVLELGEIPLGNLADDVVQRRLKARGSSLGDGVGKLREGVAECNLGGGVGKRVPSSLGGKSGRSRESSVHFCEKRRAANPDFTRSVGSRLSRRFTRCAGNRQLTDDHVLSADRVEGVLDVASDHG